MKFNGITKKGREYLAKVQAENLPIQFSKIKIGDGRLDDYDDPTELTALRNLKVELGILSKTQEAETVTLITNIDNVSLAQGYYPREIGVFVRDGDREILYYYMNDGDETSWVPPESDGPFKIGLKINLIVSNAQSIVVQNSGKDLYITKEYLEENYTKNGGSNNNALQIEDRVTAAVGGLAGMFPLSQATANNIYYCEGNKKFYVCKSNYDGTRISVPNMNFEELSIFENRKRLENLITFSKIKDWEIIELPNKKVILTTRKRVSFSLNKYTFELPFNIENEIVLASSEDLNNQVLFAASKTNNEIQVKRWPDNIAGGSNFVNIYIIASKIII